MKIKSKITVFFVLIALIVISVITIKIYFKFNDTEIIAKVTDKVAKLDHGESKYLIFTDQGVFENTDTFLRFKFDSSDFYAKIEKEHRYKFTVIGIRFPFLSWYKNIIAVEEIK